MLKRKNIRIGVCMLLIMCVLCSCGRKTENNDKDGNTSNLPEVTTTYTTYVRDKDGNITKVDEGFVDENGNDVSTIDKETETEAEIDPNKKTEVEPGKLVYLESKMRNDGVPLYQMIAYAELKKGFDFSFETMRINGIDYFNDNYEVDKKYVDAYSIKISDDTVDNARYLVTFSCTEEFGLEDIELTAKNFSNEEYNKDVEAKFEIDDLSNIDFHKTYSSTLHFIQVGEHYYLWDQKVPKKIIATDEEYTYKTAITPDTIIWASEGGSSDELFTTIAANYKWANELHGRTFDSEYATLTLEEIDGELCLVKTAREDLEDETSNPAYVTYTEEGYDTLYFVIV